MSQLIDEFLLDAIAVISWELSDDEFADALNSEARQMARIPSDDIWTVDADTPLQ